MAYLALAVIFLSTGLSLLASETGQLLGVSLPINFGELKNVAGLAFIALSILLFRAGVRHLRNVQ